MTPAEQKARDIVNQFRSVKDSMGWCNLTAYEAKQSGLIHVKGIIEALEDALNPIGYHSKVTPFREILTAIEQMP